ncbi:MAG TPA: hypothetical protein VIJ02_10925 [Thermoanaerobaculia bacterium]
MPTQDEIMDHILKLVSEGAGGALPDDVKAALRERYYQWIAEGKKGATITPQQVWHEKDGEGLQRKFREIGKRLAAKNKSALSTADCVECYLAVEAAASLECPFCPDTPPPGI